MNQNTPNPRLIFRWPYQQHFAHWIRWRGCSRISISITGGTWHSGLAAGKRRRWEKPLPRRTIMLNLRGECRTKALRETGEIIKHQEQSGVKPEEITWTSFHQAIFHTPLRLEARVSGIPVIEWLPHLI